MKLNEVLNEGLKRSYEVNFTSKELDEKVTEKLESVQADFPQKGFRKGKVPISLIKQIHGKTALEEVANEIVNTVIREHFEKTGDKPALQPLIEFKDDEWKNGKDLNVKFEYEIIPNIPETELNKMKFEKLIAKIDKKAIDDALKNLSETTPNFLSKRKGSKTKKGDQVIFDFDGKVDKKPFDGGSAKDYPLILGSNSFIPGFEDQLLGHKVDEIIEVKVTFPSDYAEKKLSGKNAIFSCKINDIKEKKPSKIDDELAKKYGSMTLKDLKDKIKERLNDEFNQISVSILKRDLMDKLDKMIKLDLPKKLVENEAKEIAFQLWQEKNKNLKEKDHKEIKPSKSDNKLAMRRVKLGLFLADIGQKNDIKVEDSELQKEIMERARQYPGKEKEFSNFILNNNEAKQQISAPLFENKVVDFIFEVASVKEKEVSTEELKKIVEKLDS